MNYDLILLVGYVLSGAVFTLWLLWVLYVFVMSLLGGEPCWRRSIAEWVANALLNPFDPSGKHIH